MLKQERTIIPYFFIIQLLFIRRILFVLLAIFSIQLLFVAFDGNRLTDAKVFGSFFCDEGWSGL